MYIACLMAGTSSRLLPLTRTDHKAMLKVGELRLIDVQMKTFTDAGIEKFSFVVGHGGTHLGTYLLENYSATALAIINNVLYANRNLDWSAYLALSSRPGDVIYYEGDILASPEIMRQLAADPADICLVMDTAAQSARVDTRVIQKSDGTYELLFLEHGNTPLGPSEGEFVCLVKLSNRAREYVVEKLEQESYGGPMRLYEIFNDLMQCHSCRVMSTAGLPWVEIDNQEDLLRAGNVVQQIFQT
jgi:choline kinase